MRQFRIEPEVFSILPHLMTAAAKKNHIDKKIVIPVPGSGNGSQPTGASSRRSRTMWRP